MKSSEIQEKIIEISNRHSIDSVNIQQFSKEDIYVNIAFLGEFSTGKTTIINALLGKKLLPTFPTPTNAVIAEISNGDEDLFQVLKLDDAGNELLFKIEQMELANEITKPELNKKVIIKLEDIVFLKDNLTIIDTPGINSINEMHTDVTYGYLPFVDIAFIVLNMILTVPKTLLEFLKQFPEDQLSKIIIVLNFCDKFSEVEINKLKNSISKVVSEIVVNPRIIIVSAKEALELKEQKNIIEYKKTGIYEIEKIINEEIPRLKDDIQEIKYCKYLTTQANNLKSLLKIKLDSLTWNTEELDDEIKKADDEINKLNSDLSKFKNDFEYIKNLCFKKLRVVISENVEIIGHKISNDEPYDDILNIIIDETNNILKKTLSGIGELKMDSINQNFSEIIKSSLNSDSQQIKAIANLLTDVATFAAMVWLVPAPPATKTATETATEIGTVTATEVSAASSVLIAGKGNKIINEVSKTGDKLQNLGKILGFIGKVIKEINPFEKIKTAVLPYFLNPSLRKLLGNKFINKIEMIFDDIEFEIKHIIEDNYLNPIKQKEELLNTLKKNRKVKTISTDKTKETIENDINSLEKII